MFYPYLCLLPLAFRAKVISKEPNLRDPMQNEALGLNIINNNNEVCTGKAE